MRKIKQFAALGLSVAMVSAMAVGVHAADNRFVNEKGEGNTRVEGSANIDVDGYLTADPIVDPSGSLIEPTGPSLSQSETSVLVPTQTTDSAGNPTSTLVPTATDGNGPVDSNGSHVSWGDESTKNTTQLILTAPTKLSFQVAGRGTDANIMTESTGKNITGTIVNQSCYVDEDLMVVPKTVAVKGTATTVGTPAFKLIADTDTLPTDATAVKGVYLWLGNEKVDFATMTTQQEVGTLAKGEKAVAANGKWAVQGTKTPISFMDKNGKASDVSTSFASGYDGSNLKTNYNVNMVYSVK
ncbi:hypothetical protein DWX43_16965 [Clostridium sp. AF19-22AC]|jgi:hypothetical protein|uniref:hypothetical protein n=1 Tax=Clostridia TaxID=186801 RepID=UPI000E52FA00|nr:MULTISPECIES: hypothetical protein [Clostridia]RHR25816.1 hypothetical protein DWX43_16965 [Clostridium sp. AF19-22AC]